MDSSSKPQLSITLYRGFPQKGVYVWSPFVTKLEARLRFAGLSYNADAGSPVKAPRGKIPYIEISNPDAAPFMLSDSSQISARFVGEGLIKDLNVKLSPAEKAQDLALRALLEDKLYYYQCYERWHQNFYTMRPHTLEALPYPVQVIVGLLAYRKMTTTLYGQGTGRFSAEEIASFRQQIWEAIDELLRESKRKATSGDPFWLLRGQGPSEADTTLFGFVASAIVCRAGPESMELVKGLPTVMEYARRIHEVYFPDYVWPE